MSLREDAFWRGFWEGISGGRGEAYARAWGCVFGFGVGDALRLGGVGVSLREDLEALAAICKAQSTDGNCSNMAPSEWKPYGWMHAQLRALLDRQEPAPNCESVAEESQEGSLVDDGISIAFGGCCPVQGTGLVDGYPCYYRSRGTGWSLSVWSKNAWFQPGDDLPGEDPIWEVSEHIYDWPDGGYVLASESIENIRRAVAAFRRHLAGK